MESNAKDILDQFRHMQNTGLLDAVEDLKKENRDLKRRLDDIRQLISYTTVDSMLNFIISKFIDYFIPQSLIFMIKPPRKQEIRQYWYRQMARTKERLPDEYFNFFLSLFQEKQEEDEQFTVLRFSELLMSNPSDMLLSDDLLSCKPSLLVPLIGINGIFGIVILCDKTIGGDYTAQDVEYINTIFSTLALTLQNGLHYENSITDSKTGLYTFDYFLTRITNTISETNRYKRTAGMLMLDIDHFKLFNDNWGHLTGDRVLAEIADTIKKTIRSNDCPARFGGEEFSILLSECNEDTLLLVGERVRNAISRIRLNVNGQELSVTVSVGGCLIKPIQGLTPTMVFDKADQALYHSKNTGRNRTTIMNMGLLDRARMMQDSPTFSRT